MANNKEFLTFKIGREQFAVDILRVQEIRGWEKPNPLPSVPPFVKGVVDLRGSVVPIVDLRERFKLQARYDATTVVIVVHVLTSQGERVVGIVVDEVSDVQSFDMDSLQPAPDISTEISSQFILGLATVGDAQRTGEMEDSRKASSNNMVILVDLDRLISEGIIDEISQNGHMPFGNG
ncbi:chemotaxis protein CheW [Thiomicrorhabdus xiamenensis]|uniref:Chemotaxis protein CheW n=1 Tax=Thiomicrorhabdus xiamenensis TaxID=2739063 RepID=A0A7D4P4M3_9GAMM|nr:chemotaxis protein CheW [Thiomicrorhabdus xiamenensis]QKI88995.1 purine-binding chemotaxis protein CheW [Thiomicrorhabdus xiamenensis]